MLEGSSRTESMRQIISYAVQTGRHWTSGQTGYIHYTYHNQEEDHKCIPFYENWLFVLALFRTKIAENILEAKAIIEKMLSFQAPDGNYPVYLHEFPVCYDDCQSIRLLPVLYWILKDYQTVLGLELKSKLENALEGLLEFALQLDIRKKLPIPFRILLFAALHAYGSYKNDTDRAEAGERGLAEIASNLDQYEQFSTQKLGQMLIGLQMVYESLARSPFHKFWDYLVLTWCQKSNAYCGPAFCEWQLGSYPKGGIYDIFMRFFSIAEHYPFDNQHFFLAAALIRPSEDIIESVYPLNKEGAFGEARWLIHKNENYCYSVIAKKEPVKPEEQPGFYFFRMVWGLKNNCHTFACQEGQTTLTKFTQMQNGLALEFLLPEQVQAEIREKARELDFYLSIETESKVLVSDLVANTFTLDDRITIIKDGLHIDLWFDLLEGDGHFQGHIMPGNRPSQKMKNLMSAYDKQIFVRTVRRSPRCKIKVTIEVNRL